MPEVRTYKVTNIEIRDGTDGRTITGYPVVFDKPSQNLGGFIEYVVMNLITCWLVWTQEH